jgi:hypothetical protein
MSEKSAEKNGSTRDALRTERVRSQVFIFNRLGQFMRVESDGEFVLEIDGAGVVRGTHSHPASHDVSGNLMQTTPPNIFLSSADGIRAHTGALVTLGAQEHYVGARLPLTERALLEQEEGVWVGTKI